MQCKNIHTFESKVHEYIVDHQFFSQGEKVLVGVSGGADSIALLDLLYNFHTKVFPLELAVVSLDHGIREESKEEILWLKEYVKNYNLPFFTRRIELLMNGTSSLEERARKQRYSFFVEIAKHFGAQKVALAHHQNDQAETVMMNILKGTGVRGLCGMPQSRSISSLETISLIRPLLSFQKEDIINYLVHKKIEWKEDISNKDNRYKRNSVRNEIIPFIKNHGYEKIVNTLCQLSFRLNDIQNYLEKQAHHFFETYFYSQAPSRLLEYISLCQCDFISIDCHIFQTIDNAIFPYVLKEVTNKLGLGIASLREVHYQAIKMLSSQQKGALKLPKGFEITKTPKQIHFMHNKETSFFVPCKLKEYSSTFITKYSKIIIQKSILENFDLATFKQSQNNFYAVDTENIQFPLTLRHYRNGDTIKNLGNCGYKKVSKIVSDMKIPKPLRKKILVLEDKNFHIIWISGVCISEEYKVDKQTKNILTIEIIHAFE